MHDSFGWLAPEGTAARVALAAVLALSATAFSLMALVGLTVHDFSRRSLGLSLLSQTILLIAVYAGTYYAYDAGHFGGEWQRAVYFTIVTWTTLGYGDIAPPSDLELLAAAEALLGYVFLGLIVAWSSALISRS